MADVLRARLLADHGFRHGFSLRTGGKSSPPYDSLNLGRAVGDEADAVADNHRRFAAAVGYDPELLFETSQVHGKTVVAVSLEDDPVATRAREADALLATERGVAVGVRVADCLPLVIGDPESGAVAAVHAGWRGVVDGVVEAALQALRSSSGSRSERLVAAAFPHIGPCCFEVGEDVAAELRAASRIDPLSPGPRGRPHVDLAAIVADKLRMSGVSPDRFVRVAGCTRCDPTRFFSYRRDGSRSGRHLAAITVPGDGGDRRG